jgi:hypothetical protein
MTWPTGRDIGTAPLNGGSEAEEDNPDTEDEPDPKGR